VFDGRPAPYHTDDLPRLKQFWQEHWLGEEMMVRRCLPPEHVEGFVNEDWTGLVTWDRGQGCEIVS
jgi:hypothetical protein